MYSTNTIRPPATTRTHAQTQCLAACMYILSVLCPHQTSDPTDTVQTQTRTETITIMINTSKSNHHKIKINEGITKSRRVRVHALFTLSGNPNAVVVSEAR